IYTAAKYGALPARTYRRPARVAAYIEARARGLTDRLVSGVELAEAAAESRYYSPSLARAAVADVAARLHDFKPRSLVDYREARPAGLAAGLLGAGAIVLALAAPGASAGAWSSLWGNHLAAAYHTGEIAFLAGDIQLTYRYPAYTGLEPLEIKNASGEIEAAPGTQVELRVTAARGADEAALDMEDGEDLPLKAVGANRFEGMFTLLREGRYRFRFDDDAENRSRAIRLTPDRPPAVTLDLPPGDLDVRESDAVELAYRLEDDYGLSEAALVIDYAAGKGREQKRIPLKKFSEPTKADGDAYLWELAGERFRPGDEVAYYVEALDNDTVNGPKPGRSETRKLKIFSVTEHHQKLLERQEQIWEAMLGLLAKYLTQTIDAATVPNMGTLTKELEGTNMELSQAVVDPLGALINELREDPLSTETVEALLAQIYGDLDAHRREYADAADILKQQIDRRVFSAPPIYRLDNLRQGSIQRLEKYIIALDELLQKQKYDALVAESEKLAGLRDELRQLLEQYKNTKDEAVKKLIDEKLKELRDRLADLQRKLAEVRREIPEEFVNLEALDMKSMGDSLDSLENLLKEGHLDQALAQLEDLSQQLNGMFDKLKEGSEDLGESLYSESAKKLMEFQKDLAQLTDKQKELQRATEQRAEAYRKKLAEEFKANLERAMKKLAEKTEEARRETGKVNPDFDNYIQHYRDLAESNLADLKTVLDSGDLSGAEEVAQQAQQNLNNMLAYLQGPPEFMGGRRQPPKTQDMQHGTRAKELVDEVIEELEKIQPDPSKLMGEPERQRLEQMARMQQELSNEGQRLEQGVRQLGEELPMLPGDAGQRMREANNGMQRSSSSLSQLKPGPADGFQRQAIHNLTQLQEGLNQALQQMQSGMRFGGMRPIMRGGKGEGGRETSQEKVAIPQAEQYQTPKELREDLLDAMRRKAPEEYAPQNRQYYKELVK
ncbi:MAG: DUF4175 family protein, partial [Myxococcales bacterium]